MEDGERIKAIADYEVLDTLPEREFDDIVELASAICGTPISAISLLDMDRQWFKAQVGLDTNQTPIEQSFCRYAALDPDHVMVVNDSLDDDRFKNNPLTLGDPHIRFYAGAPLVTDEGVAIGALCVIDRQPREFSELERRMLQVLAGRIMKLLEMRKENLQQRRVIQSTTDMLETTVERLLEAQNTARIGNWDWHMQTGEIYWSPQIYQLMSPLTKPLSIRDRQDWEALIHPDDLPAVRASLDLLIQEQKPTRVEFRINLRDSERWILRTSDVKVNKAGEVERIFGIMQDITERKKAEQAYINQLSMLENMLYDVSHRIRKPLTTLLGILPILNKPGLSSEEEYKTKEYFYASLSELDDYTRELNEQLHKNKMDIILHRNQ